MACFADVNVSRCKVRWDFLYPFNCKFTKEYFTEKIVISVKNWQNYGHESVTPFFGPPCTSDVDINVLSRASSLLSILVSVLLSFSLTLLLDDVHRNGTSFVLSRRIPQIPHHGNSRTVSFIQ